MPTTRHVSLLGLGFGDCGKGVFTDALCRRWPVHTVVRFNGGAQAGHNVVLADGRHHTFCQFAAGTFLPGVATVLAYPVVVHPSALLVEHRRLRALGVDDALARLRIDSRCRIDTPFHQAAGRLREWRRGNGAHGSCGVGVGETVRHALRFPEQVLRYADLARPALAMRKLAAIRGQACAEFDRFDTVEALAGASASGHDDALAEYRLLHDERLAEQWLCQVSPLLEQSPPASPATIAERLDQPGSVLYEGAQGVLLDEWRGFHPHTTWSRIHPRAVAAVAAAYGVARRSIEHFGILRTYPTRHGQGPLPTFDPALDALPEPHNGNDGWQGRFRRGHPDAVLLRYALAAVGSLDGVLISHLDVFEKIDALRWCDAYRLEPNERCDTLPLGPARDLAYQSRLTRRLLTAKPHYESPPVSSADDFIARVAALAKCPPRFGAFGPTAASVTAL